MVEKPGRNDPCPCGSGKKYKSCCFQKQEKVRMASIGKPKFTAKVLSSGLSKIKQVGAEQAQTMKPPVDYSTLMERSFGESLHTHEEKPPVPPDPSAYLGKQEDSEPHSEAKEE